MVKPNLIARLTPVPYSDGSVQIKTLEDYSSDKSFLEKFENNSEPFVKVLKNMAITGCWRNRAVNPEGTIEVKKPYSMRDETPYFAIDIRTGEEKSISLEEFLHHVTFSNKGKLLGTTNSDGFVDIYDTDSWEKKKKFELPTPELKHSLWDKLLRKKPEWVPYRRTPDSWGIEFSPDDTLVGVGYENGSLRIWDVDSETIQFEWRDDRYPIQSLSFNPIGDQIAYLIAQHVVIRDLTTGNLVKRYFAKGNSGHSIDFSNDGKILVHSTQGNTFLLNISRNKRITVPMNEEYIDHRRTVNNNPSRIAYSTTSQSSEGNNVFLRMYNNGVTELFSF